MTSLDYFRHDFPASRLQRSLAGAGQEPHTFVFVAAINDVNAVACHCVMKRSARVFGDESDESVPPRVLGVREDLFADLLELFNADRSNRFRDRFAALFIKVLKVKFFEWHKKSALIFPAHQFPGNRRRGLGTGLRVRAGGKRGFV